MWYNCTFPQNETLNNACRSSGNTTTSADQGVSACFLGVGNATHFNQCVGTRGNETDVKCYLQDWSNKAPASASAGSESAARPHRPKEFSWTTLFCLGLMVLNCVVAQVEPEKDPTCTRFVADDKSTWHLNAETQHVVVSNGLGCFSGLSHPCLMGMENRILYFEPIWASDSPEGPISVTGDFKSLDRPEGRAIADKVYIPFVPDEFPVPSGPIGIVWPRPRLLQSLNVQ